MDAEQLPAAERQPAGAAVEHAQREQVWRHELARLTAELEFAKGLRPSMLSGADHQFFGLRKDEAAYHVQEARLLEMRRRDGRDVGWVAITDCGQVYAGGKRMRFDFAKMLAHEWIDRDSLVIDSAARQKPAGVEFPDPSFPVGATLSIALADQRGPRGRPSLAGSAGFGSTYRAVCSHLAAAHGGGRLLHRLAAGTWGHRG